MAARNDQYFTREPESASRPRECAFSFRGRELRFTTDAGVFSRGELDEGTRLLLETLPERMSGRLLDLGCGWGPVGAALGKRYPALEIVMTDVNRRATALARRNLAANGVRAEVVEGDGFEAVEGRFDAVITNPPIRAGKVVIYGLFDAARARLVPGGALYVVIRKQQGAPSALNHLRETYASAEVIEREAGYWVLRAENGAAGDSANV